MTIKVRKFTYSDLSEPQAMKYQVSINDNSYSGDASLGTSVDVQNSSVSKIDVKVLDAEGATLRYAYLHFDPQSGGHQVSAGFVTSQPAGKPGTGAEGINVIGFTYEDDVSKPAADNYRAKLKGKPAKPVVKMNTTTPIGSEVKEMTVDSLRGASEVRRATDYTIEAVGKDGAQDVTIDTRP